MPDHRPPVIQIRGEFSESQIPTADFTWAINGFEVTFTNTSSDPDGDDLTFNWYFGDGNTSTDIHPIHTYSAEGQYSVQLFASDGYGGVSDYIESVTVGEPPPVFDISHLSGWNLVGTPCETPTDSYSDIYPTSVPGTLYGFSGTYVGEVDLVAGYGYWLFFDDSGTQIVECENQLDEVYLTLIEGWNLISGISTEVCYYDTDTCPDNAPIISDPDVAIVPGTLYGFNGTYESGVVLELGKGYWIHSSIDGATIGICSQDVIDAGECNPPSLYDDPESTAPYWTSTAINAVSNLIPEFPSYNGFRVFTGVPFDIWLEAEDLEGDWDDFEVVLGSNAAEWILHPLQIAGCGNDPPCREINIFGIPTDEDVANPSSATRVQIRAKDQAENTSEWLSFYFDINIAI